jgi:hypothetical protein
MVKTFMGGIKTTNEEKYFLSKFFVISLVVSMLRMIQQ